MDIISLHKFNINGFHLYDDHANDDDWKLLFLILKGIFTDILGDSLNSVSVYDACLPVINLTRLLVNQYCSLNILHIMQRDTVLITPLHVPLYMYKANHNIHYIRIKFNLNHTDIPMNVIFMKML